MEFLNISVSSTSDMSTQSLSLCQPCRGSPPGAAGDEAPLFSGFQSLCPDLGVARPWLGFWLPSVHRSSFWILHLKCTCQAPLLEHRQGCVFVPRRVACPLWSLGVGKVPMRHLCHTGGRLPQVSPPPPPDSKVCWIPASGGCRQWFSAIPSLWFMRESIFLNWI